MYVSAAASLPFATSNARLSQFCSSAHKRIHNMLSNVAHLFLNGSRVQTDSSGLLRNVPTNQLHFSSHIAGLRNPFSKNR